MVAVAVMMMMVEGEAYAFVVLWVCVIVGVDEDVPVLHLVIGYERLQHWSRLYVRCIDHTATKPRARPDRQA
jgi:hypothetical protein